MRDNIIFVFALNATILAVNQGPEYTRDRVTTTSLKQELLRVNRTYQYPSGSEHTTYSTYVNSHPVYPSASDSVHTAVSRNFLLMRCG